jgi:hypothetical protein
MMDKQLFDLLDKEKEKLFKAEDYINTYYYEIATGLESLRDNIFPYAFSPDNLWKTAINKESLTISLPDSTLENFTDDPHSNSSNLVSLINNMYAIQNVYLGKPANIDLQDIKLINKVHNFLLAFLQKQYSHQNLATFKKKQLELAISIKNSIENRILNNINPFFQRLEMIKSDEYLIYLFDVVKSIVGNYETYKRKPDYYDKIIEKKCTELNIKNNSELNLLIIADLSKSEALLNVEIKSKYESIDREKPTAKPYRLREIASRYVSQAENLTKLENFLMEFYNITQTSSFLKRLFYFLLSLLTGKRFPKVLKDITYRYFSPQGKIETREASLLQLIKRTGIFSQFLLKARDQFNYFSPLKGIDSEAITEMEKVIDNCFFELNDIYEQSAGFREWLGKDYNKRVLRKISEKRQDEFSNLLLTLNRIIIVNKYNLMDFEKYKKL